MCKGHLVSINITEKNGAPIQSLPEIHAYPGKGLLGDRHYNAKTSSNDNLVSFIEIEAIQALRREKDIRLDPPDARRNLVTSGVPLNHLVGAEFRVGDVSFKGVRLCEPCRHLEKLTTPGVLSGLIHRGGLLAAVLNEGVIRKGDTIVIM
jgi:MOSC domain-containing protein YiiM